MAVVLKGGPELRARLAAAASSQTRLNMNRAWQEETRSGAKATAPRRTGRGAASIASGFVSDVKAFVNGAYWLIFVDRGAHWPKGIQPKSVTGSTRGGRGTAKWLKFDWNGTTVFAKKVHRRPMRRRPFITAAAQKALREGPMMDQVIAAWNRKRAGRFTRTRAA